MQLKWPMRWDLFSLFPAYAGVIPVVLDELKCLYAFPRIRGGDPGISGPQRSGPHFSPHTRG